MDHQRQSVINKALKKKLRLCEILKQVINIVSTFKDNQTFILKCVEIIVKDTNIWCAVAILYLWKQHVAKTQKGQRYIMLS
jgi:hypothetical protein